MKKLFPVAVTVFLSLLLLAQIGCNSDEDPNDVAGPCDINLTRPLPGEVFLSGQEVKIFWNKSGLSPTVSIQLFKGGNFVEEITDPDEPEENDGYFFWIANNLGQPNGDDFTVTVSAVGEDNCMDESPEFALTNVVGCNFDFIAPPPMNPVMPDTLSLEADGSTYDITWFSSFTSGDVDLQLFHVNDFIGYIATDIPDSTQHYEWTIDSLHEGSGSSFKILIQDTEVSSCKRFSPIFDLIDNDICLIEVVAPVADDELEIGEIFDIEWTAQQVEGNLDIYLYYDGEQIEVVALGVDPGAGMYSWVVWAPLPGDNESLYYIKIIDSDNSVAPCQGRSSGAFLITN